jgi:hypothetical protein
MRRILTLASVVSVFGTGIGCTSSTAPSPEIDSGVPADSSAQPVADSATGKTVTLTVLNFLSWCSVTINGGASSTAATVTASVASGSVATVVVTPASSAFQIGTDPWFGVDQNNGGAAGGTDVGSGTTETSTATVTITGTGTTQCVSVCCQEPNMSPTPCPTTNPCP